jgi:hypothetical protein
MVQDEIESQGIEIQVDEEAVRHLDYFGHRSSIVVEWDGDEVVGATIILRPEDMDNALILREELIHYYQQAYLKLDPSEQLFFMEVQAREAIIHNRHSWILTNDQIRRTINDLREIIRRGSY